MLGDRQPNQIDMAFMPVLMTLVCFQGRSIIANTELKVTAYGKFLSNKFYKLSMIPCVAHMAGFQKYSGGGGGGGDGGCV